MKKSILILLLGIIIGAVLAYIVLPRENRQDTKLKTTNQETTRQTSQEKNTSIIQDPHHTQTPAKNVPQENQEKPSPNASPDTNTASNNDFVGLENPHTGERLIRAMHDNLPQAVDETNRIVNTGIDDTIMTGKKVYHDIIKTNADEHGITDKIQKAKKSKTLHDWWIIVKGLHNKTLRFLKEKVGE